ncbi:unnamed protein product, partial [Prorocentrum cordatum]
VQGAFYAKPPDINSLPHLDSWHMPRKIKLQWVTQLPAAAKRSYRKRDRRMRIMRFALKAKNMRIASLLTKLDTLQHVLALAKERDNDLKTFHDTHIQKLEDEDTS